MLPSNQIVCFSNTPITLSNLTGPAKHYTITIGINNISKNKHTINSEIKDNKACCHFWRLEKCNWFKLIGWLIAIIVHKQYRRSSCMLLTTTLWKFTGIQTASFKCNKAQSYLIIVCKGTRNLIKFDCNPNIFMTFVPKLTAVCCWFLLFNEITSTEQSSPEEKKMYKWCLNYFQRFYFL